MFQKLEFFRIHIWFGAKKLSEQLSGGGGGGRSGGEVKKEEKGTVTSLIGGMVVS